MEIAALYNLYLSHPLVQTDTRNIETNSLFFALKGPNFNGNHYVKQALAAGAAYCITDEKQLEADERIILVEDSLTCLQQLALHHRRQFTIPVIAITGSNGKTTTKELVHAVLSQKYNCHTTTGNLNNHIGIPLTILKMKVDTEIAVIEMGANHMKEIEGYCEITEPTHGLITNCGKAHLEGFGSEENIIKGKTELYSWLKNHKGTVFINNDYTYLKDNITGIKQVISYGTEEADYTGTIANNERYLEVEITKGTTDIKTIATQLVGAYNLSNVLSAVCIGKTFRVPEEAIKSSLETYKSSNSRSQWMEKDGNNIILDAYNANPTSMKAAIENFAAMPVSNKLLVLGSMMELGETADIEHQDLIRLIEKYKWDEVILTGNGFDRAQHNYIHFTNAAEVAAWIKDKQMKNKHILIKGSRSMKMEEALH